MSKRGKDLYDRYEELYEQAVNTYLDKTDFSPYDWLNKNEAQELKDLDKEINGNKEKI